MAALAEEDAIAVENFRNFLRIKSVHPNPDHEGVKNFLQPYAQELGTELKVIEFTSGVLVFLLTITGENPALPSILLNSHYDVVPVDESKWKVDPFSAHMDEEGNIFARGAQDMKCVTIQHLEALKRLLKSGYKPLRTIHVTIMPDEEIGGHRGMAPFIKSPIFQEMNVGVALDEGLASMTDKFTVFYGERVAWWIDVIAEGPTGHGSRFIENPAAHRLLRSIQKFLEFRKEQEAIFHTFTCECGKTLGDLVTINLAKLEAGTAYNVVPSKAKASFDIRIPPSVSLEEFRAKLEEWTSEEGVRFEMYQGDMINNSSPIDSDSLYWNTFKNSINDLGLDVNTEIFPAATDSRYLRQIGIPAFGFSPINNTPILLHDHNEFLNDKVFTRGIEVFIPIIRDLSSLQ